MTLRVAPYILGSRYRRFAGTDRVGLKKEAVLSFEIFIATTQTVVTTDITIRNPNLYITVVNGFINFQALAGLKEQPPAAFSSKRKCSVTCIQSNYRDGCWPSFNAEFCHVTDVDE
jgi:hypothetical protein